MTRIAKVVVDIALDREFDYLVPEEFDGLLHVGSPVRVPFGPREAQGYIVGFSERSDRPNLRAIKKPVGKKSLISETTMKLARWMADYYAAPFEQAVKTILPSAVRAKGARHKEQLSVVPTPLASETEAVDGLRKRAPKQAAVLDVLASGETLFLSQLVHQLHTTAATVRGLEKKGFVRIGLQRKLRDPFAEHDVIRTKPHDLMPEQATALARVRQSIDQHDPAVVLLHGVTGSGKTEVYLQAIQHALDQEKGAILLVPEISLTPQMVEGFLGRFGETIAVLHSHLSSGERHDEWHRIHDGRARIAIGARSALFAPVRNLGLIVVDEEHEHTYKQEKAPRYNARDMAVLRGRMEPCAVVLGSATPSLESYYNAMNGKYALERLNHRVDHREMPHMRIVDMRATKDKQGAGHILSKDLVEAIRERLQRAEQVILFLNRRGFSTSLICPKCGHVAKCELCSVAMTFHKKEDLLRCHICGEGRQVPKQCPEPTCRDPAIRYSGTGTQRVEEVVSRIFPKARVQRMDSDTTTRKDSHRKILSAFRNGEIDILVGTQMIAKGLHFPNVTLVGVVFADTTLHMPDFRAGERTFQMLTQVAGRAGRGDVAGEVIVQTFTPFHPAVQAARRMDYDGFADQELEFRREVGYPPYLHLISVLFKGPGEELTRFTAETFAKKLRPRLPETVILKGVAPAPLNKARGMYRFQLILLDARTARMAQPLKAFLKEFTWPDKVSYQVDVDALSLM